MTTPTPQFADSQCTAALLQAQKQWPQLRQGRIGIAFSGGADSTALLYAAAQLWPERVVALHINHQLQTQASSFAAQCAAHSAGLQIPFVHTTLSVDVPRGGSVEALARQARYRALAQAAQDSQLSAVLLAQHADDQAETVLLALSRGAGVAGLAAMPRQFTRHACWFLRPFLDLPGPVLKAALERAGIAWCEDPMNHDLQYTRSRIRHTLLPVLEQHFPAWRQTFARSAAHAASAAAVLQEVAEADLQKVGKPPRIAALQRLSADRRALVLRHWLLCAHQQQASSAQLQALQTVIMACTTRAHQIHLKVGLGFVLRRDSCLEFVADSVQKETTQVTEKI